MSVCWDEGFDPDLFGADEIDRMEAVMLDSMDLEDLKAYKSRIMRTLKAIKVQEQLWKGEGVRFCTPSYQIDRHDLQLRTNPAQCEHKDEEGTILLDRGKEIP